MKRTPRSRTRSVEAAGPPSRLPRFALIPSLALVAIAFGAVWGVKSSGLQPTALFSGVPGLVRFAKQAWPPSLAQRATLQSATIQTLEMAVVGTVFGAVLSLPFAVLGARNLSPSPLIAGGIRSLLTALRAVPDLVWGLVFVVAVGLGPPAGICAITIDTIGYCGRLYAERIEEIDPGPLRALRAIGASTPAVVVCGVLPMVTPSFVASGMYALEKAVRAAVVLGLVGAGGIGIELTTAMQLYQFREAATIVIVIFVVVVAIEQTSAAVRRRIL